MTRGEPFRSGVRGRKKMERKLCHVERFGIILQSFVRLILYCVGVDPVGSLIWVLNVGIMCECLFLVASAIEIHVRSQSANKMFT